MKGSFLIFLVAGRRFALPVADVERVVLAAEVTPLPDAPLSIPGVVNVAGEVLPVVDLRVRLGAPGREMELSDRFVLVRGEGRLSALLVDEVEGVRGLASQTLSLPRSPEEKGERDVTAEVALEPGEDEVVFVENAAALWALSEAWSWKM